MKFQPGTRLTWLYLLVQAVSGFLWWIWLVIDPNARSGFTPDQMSSSYIMSYFLPDSLLFVLGSAIVSVAYLIRHQSRRLMHALLTGAVMYACLHCIGIQYVYGGFTGATLMMIIAGVCTTILFVLSRNTDSVLPRIPFVESVPNQRVNLWVRAGVQLMIFWIVFLFVFPVCIRFIERDIGIVGFEPNPVLGWIYFGFASLLGLASTVSMIVYGRGTPLPTDTASELVVRGVYAYTRNPMVIAGLSQGIGVALVLGSWMMFPYLVIGGLLWNFCVRPIEEQDMADRFGESYLSYRKQVGCWTVRFRK